MSLSTNLISGLSSGFDWRTMIDQLIAVEHRRVDFIEDKKSEYESKLSAWQSFNTKLLAFKTASEGLKDSEDFYLYTASISTDSATVDGDDRLSVSTSTSAAPGTYEIVVTDLATAQKLSSNPFTSQTAELGSSYAGDIIVNGKALTISATDSLADVAYNINALNTGSDPSGVTTTVINYGANDYRLILTSDDTGADGMSLLNGSSADLVQKFGWKDLVVADPVDEVKNPITNGAQSDRFTSQSEAMYTLIGLSGSRSASVTINNQAVTINLSDSLTQIKDDIDALTGVSASVISEIVDGTTYCRLQIEGPSGFGTNPTDFVDTDNILNTLGIVDFTSTPVSGKVSANDMTSDGATITPETLLVNIDGYNTWTTGGQAGGGDYITLTGTDTGGIDIGTVYFDISSSSTVQDLLAKIETEYGDVIAYVTSDGNIRVDDLTGGSSLAVTFTPTVQDSNSSIDFGAFGDASARTREVIAGKDASITVDGVTVTNSSNIIDNIIEGVTLNLVGEDSGTPITITLKIEHDITAIKSNIKDLVDKYNNVMSYINSQFSYDEDSETTGGILFGDGTLSSVKSDLTSALTNKIWGVDSDFSALSMIGIGNKQDEDGNWVLSIDDTTLTGYLQTDFNDVMSLFVAQGVTSTSTLSYIDHSRDSEAGTYTVRVKRAATQGTETGSKDLVTSGIANAETLTITQGDKTATISLSAGDKLADIKNAINEELDTEYTETLVGDQELKEDDNATYITSETTWDNIFGTTLANDDVIEFSGTTRGGTAVSESYTISNVTSDKVQGLLSAIEDAFSSEVTATINTNGKIVLTDKNVGASELSLVITEPATRNLDFGTVLTTNTGGQEGRYTMAITATDDGSNHLVLRSDDCGSTSFTIDQDITGASSYDHIIYTTTGNTVKSTIDGADTTVYITGEAGESSGTTWENIYGATIENLDQITISGKARDGITNISGLYTINNVTTDTVDGLLTAIQTAYSDQGTTVDVFIRDGKIYVEDTTTGSSAIELTLAHATIEGLDLGTFTETTERDMDIGLINGTVTGLDVVGTIDGEDATGSGRVLTGDDGNTNTDGLSIRCTGTANDTDVGTITLTLGVAELFERALYNITDSIDGYAAFKQDSLQNRIEDFEDQIEQMEAFLDRKTETLINRFVAMEMALSSIQNQSNWLAGQLNASLSGWK